MIFGLVAIFGVMAFGFMLFVIHKAKAKFAALTCDSCGAMAKFENREDYVANVSYVVSETSDYNVHVPKPDDKGVIHEISAKGTGYAKVTISLKCPGCGAVKTLEYSIQPFKCEASEKKVLAKDAAVVKARLESAVKDMMEKYNDKEQRKSIPYTIQSIYHPRYEERTKPQAGNSDAFPFVGGVKISYHRGVSEMVDGFFLENELNGTITEPGKAKK
jgi:DNA-directed RNA polymerase subunit M/transcription elongation factor TFIIS